MKKLLLITFAILSVVFCENVLANGSSGAQNTLFFGVRRASAKALPSAGRLDFIGKTFKNSLEKSGALAGGFCIVFDGKVVRKSAWDFSGKSAGEKNPQSKVGNFKFDEKTPFPIGKTSLALISLALLENKKIDFDKPVKQYCSFFKFGGEKGGEFVTAKQLLSMMSGLDSTADKLVPKDCRPFEIFEIAAQITPFTAPDMISKQSALGVELACEASAYAANPTSKNLKKSFLADMKKNLFDKLEMKSVRLSNPQNPIFLMNGFCLNLDDIAKWLETETSSSPKISDELSISARRVSTHRLNRFSMGWLSSNRGAVNYVCCADDYMGVANIVAVIPDCACAVAFVSVGGKKSEGAKNCAFALENFTSIFDN